MVCISGAPYDTLHNIIGISGKENIGSLKGIWSKLQTSRFN